MNTPTIYKISDCAPKFPCWLWSLLENEWQQREHLIGDVDTLYDFTHWCHSETRPTEILSGDWKARAKGDSK